MEGRYRALSSRVIRRQFRDLLVKEESLDASNNPPGTIAVFPVVYQGGDEKYAPLGLGISELIIVDLGQVGELHLIERIRIETLFDELNFGQSRNVDSSTAPRLGKLLRASDLVTGTYAISRDEGLRVDVQPMNIADKDVPRPVAEDGTLEDLFRMEKRIVYGLLDRFHVIPTPLERERIDRIPTANLQAFLLYCIGLEHEDEHDFRSALVYFNQASELDPQFELAKLKTAAMDALIAAGGSRLDALAEAYKVDPPIAGDQGGSETLVQKRLENMANGSGSTFIPGPESRSPAADAARAGASLYGLPDPPPPPSK
jgi:TolB-like protein